MFELLRLAWFALRTFFGLIMLLLVAYGALWLFVKVASTASGNADPNAALRRVQSYNATQADHASQAPSAALAGAKDCTGAHSAACDRP